MAKRFTDSAKWSKAWFRTLAPELKLAWLYICDTCDHAGIWDIDIELLSFQTGVDFKLNELVDALQDRVVLFDSDSKLWIRPFFEFQYADAKDGFRAKLSAQDRLRKYGLIDIDGNPVPTVPRQSTDTPVSVPNTPSIGIGISISKKGGVGENKIRPVRPSFDFEALYRAYPRKEGKSRGLIQCDAQIKTQSDYDALSGAIARYSAHCQKTGQIVMHFGSFLGSTRTGHPWRDWLDQETGKTATEASDVSADVERFKRELEAYTSDDNSQDSGAGWGRR